MWLRRRSSIFNALSLTAAAALLLVTGLMGYTLGRHDRFVAGTAWSPSVIWWQVVVGAMLLVLAAWFWRRGLRKLWRGCWSNAAAAVARNA
jgi:membrane protein implicated in regulation of membrane protease activity